VLPEEIVHYSEWVHVMRDRFKEHQIIDMSHIIACIHAACHYHKIVAEDVIYDPNILNGERTAVLTGVLQTLGIAVKDYSTWFDCCGFGFRHILVERDFTRSFAISRKIEVMKDEVDPDMVVVQDTGCFTTLDKSQFIGKVHERHVGIPVFSDAQIVALALGAHPFRVAQLHWGSTDWRPLMDKLGIDWQRFMVEFEADVAAIRTGEKKAITWDDCDAPVVPPSASAAKMEK
jgi:heterodisulfide reductase subunit B1